MMNDISPNNPIFEPILHAAQNDSRIEAVILYGSYCRQSTFRDIDICLVMGDTKEKPRILLEYIKKFNEPFDIQEFTLLPIYIRARIMKEGKILLNKNYDFLVQLYLKTIKDFDDFKPHLQTYLETIE